MNRDFEPFIIRHPRDYGVELFLEYGGTHGNKVMEVTEVVVGEQEMFQPSSSPICFSLANAQKLLDQLYEAGFRPSEEVPVTKTEAALREHLADMRKIVANKLKVEL